MSLYHFTSERHWPVIDAAGFLKVGDPIIDPHNPNAGPQVVWLTDTPTADLGHGLLHSAVDKTEVRIEVDVPGIRWLDWSHTPTMPNWWFEIMVKAGGGMEAAEHWWVWPAPIQRRRWVNVDHVRSAQ